VPSEATNGQAKRAADHEKIGTPWRHDEFDAIVADYFAMLDAEPNGQSYVKSWYSAALMERIGRTLGRWSSSIRTSRQCLKNSDCRGSPATSLKRNYQGAIFDAIDRYLSVHGDILSFTPRGAGYDILSFDLSGRQRLIEVKTTNGAANPVLPETQRASNEQTARYQKPQQRQRLQTRSPQATVCIRRNR